METTTDPRPEFATALATTTGLVAAVRPDQLALPTPCAELDVRALLEHLFGVLDRITAVGRGGGLLTPLAERPVADEGWVDDWHEAAGALQATWADDAVLDLPSPLPWAPGTGADALVSYVTELTVHSWDLATATGQAVAWDDQVLAMAADRMAFLPAQGRHEIFAPMKAGLDFEVPDPFLDATPVADDAPLIDRVVAWYGRRP